MARAQARRSTVCCPDVRELRIYYDQAGNTCFGAGTPAVVVWVEEAFPDGQWIEDEDGRPLYWVKGLKDGGTVKVADRYADPEGS